jgi:hypothetical protein
MVNLNFVWHAASVFRNQNEMIPNWCGFMQHFSEGPHESVCETNVLPITDLKLSEETCTYSTLNFIYTQVKRLKSGTPYETFDQPLYIKAIDVRALCV